MVGTGMAWLELPTKRKRNEAAPNRLWNGMKFHAASTEQGEKQQKMPKGPHNNHTSEKPAFKVGKRSVDSRIHSHLLSCMGIPQEAPQGEASPHQSKEGEKKGQSTGLLADAQLDAFDPMGKKANSSKKFRGKKEKGTQLPPAPILTDTLLPRRPEQKCRDLAPMHYPSTESGTLGSIVASKVKARSSSRRPLSAGIFTFAEPNASRSESGFRFQSAKSPASGGERSQSDMLKELTATGKILSDLRAVSSSREKALGNAGPSLERERPKVSSSSPAARRADHFLKYTAKQRELYESKIAHCERLAREREELRKQYVATNVARDHHEASVDLEPLTDEQEQMVDEAFQRGANDLECLVERQFDAKSYGVLPIRRRDIRTLRPSQWLNDEVVNFYCGLMQERALREADGAKQPAVHHFGSFFYAKLTETGYDYEKVRRWTTWNRLGGYTVLQTERIIVPINKANVHWVVAVINLRDQRIEFYDSMGGKDAECIANLKRYISDEAANKFGEQWDTSSWEEYIPDVPKQDNCSDCGVFTLKFADAASRDKFPSDVRADHMRYFRRKIAADILRERVD